MNWRYREWSPYVSVAAKLSKGRKAAAAFAKKQKRQPQPVEVSGRSITTTFWGNAWCRNLEAYQDYSNRLPRGATYVRNGSVVDLWIKQGVIEAIVAGSEPYHVTITIQPLSDSRWNSVKRDCSASIDSLLDLLAGKLSDGVMTRLTDKKTGLFPAPAEIRMKCSCPDSSRFCKHLAAVMYGVGSRFDKQPQLLFELRGVDHQQLASQAMAAGNLDRELAASASELDGQDLGAIFGIQLDAAPTSRRAKKSSPPLRVKAGSSVTRQGKKSADAAKANAAGKAHKNRRTTSTGTAHSSRRGTRSTSDLVATKQTAKAGRAAAGDSKRKSGTAARTTRGTASGLNDGRQSTGTKDVNVRKQSDKKSPPVPATEPDSKHARGAGRGTGRHASRKSSTGSRSESQ
jgi:uncharacterized Zn finger protein